MLATSSTSILQKTAHERSGADLYSCGHARISLQILKLVHSLCTTRTLFRPYLGLSMFVVQNLSVRV